MPNILLKELILKTFLNRSLNIFVGSFFLLSIFSFIAPYRVDAAVTNPEPKAKITFTFDDGYISSLTEAAPILASYGLAGTNFVITDCVGMTVAPNTCKADPDAMYMSWDQIQQLQNQYGWEIGSHSASHPYLATSDPDDQPLPISLEQAIQELTSSKAVLESHGINVNSIAPPYGDYSMVTLAEIAKYYKFMRGFQDTGYNIWPYNELLVRDQPVDGNVKVSTVKGYIDNAIANNQWLVLTFHDIKAKASRKQYDYQYSTANLKAIAAYVKQKQDAGLIQPTTLNDASVESDTNLLVNSSFNNGISGGWNTNTPTFVTSDSNSQGSYPDPSYSVKMTSGSTNSHLFSPLVDVNESVEYVIKSYLYLQKINNGEIGYYIDEYDAYGNWISGQWKGAQYSVFARNFNFSYKPTSNMVKKASLQVYTTPNSGAVAYIDNFQMFGLSNPDPEPTPTNLVANGTFDNGLMNGWSTDSGVQVIADSESNGSPLNPVNSIKMTALSDKNIHLFSPAVVLSQGKQYSITTFANIKQITGGELGFYIDEYDSNGNWISGQWKGAKWGAVTTDVPLSYTPSSSSVASASLQIYVTANSNIVAYIDDIRWYEL